MSGFNMASLPDPNGPVDPSVFESFVYRCFDANDRLLYVGSSGNVAARVASHRGKSWGSRITRVDVQVLPTRGHAYAEERRAIRAEHPEFNVQSRRLQSVTA